MNLFKNTTIRTKRQLMTYITAMTFVFTLTILATSIAGFLVEHLQMAAQENGESLDARKALLFAGLILASASFFGLFVDTFWASLQKKHAPRSLVSAALLGLMVAVGIFLVSHISEAARLIALTLMAAAAYGWSFDLYDVTITSTILRSGKPENTAQNLSQKKVAEAIGMVCGLLLSGLVLFFGSAVAQTLLLGMLFGVLVFVRNFFDRPEDEVPLEFSANAKVPWASVLAKVGDVDGMKAHMSAAPAQVQAEILAVGQRAADEAAQLPGRAAEVLQAAKHEIVELLKRRGEIVHNVHARAEKFSFKQTFGESFQIFQEFFSLFRQDGGRGALVIWGACAVMFFSFWDTLAVTYQPLFLAEVTSGDATFRALSGVLLALFVVPIMVLQIPFARMADRFGREKFVFGGILLSAVSLLFLGSAGGSIGMVVLAGLGNSVGYAMAFTPAQAYFVSCVERGGAEQRAHSAGLLRMALNFGNIFGQLLGGAFFALFGFSFGFFVFGILLTIFSVVSVWVLWGMGGGKKAVGAAEAK